jgi:TetR/AcrR family transcriptional regulator
VNKQLINYYFESKAGLYREVQRTWLERQATFAGPDLPLAELAARYLRDALADPRLFRLLLWRGLSDPAAVPPAVPATGDDLASMRARSARGELADDLDPAAVLLAVMGMVAAPVALPGMVRKIFGLDPASPQFAETYSEQLRRIVRHLAGPDPRPDPTRPTRGHHANTTETDPTDGA